MTSLYFLYLPSLIFLIENKGNEQAEELLKTGAARVVLGFEADYAEKLAAGTPFHIKIYYDKSKTKSEGALEVLTSAIDDFNKQIVDERILGLGLDRDILVPSIVEENNVADESKAGNTIVMMTLPLMLGMLVAVGGIPAATDLVAGEKERNTFEPLLSTKPDRGSLLMGKYLAVTMFSLVSVVAIVLGMVLGYLINPNSLTMGTDANMSGFTIEPLAAFLAIVIAIALGMTFSGIQIALSTYAKSFKEAQTYMSFLIFIAIIPGYATMFMQPADISMYMYAIPVLNTIAAFKMVLGGSINYSGMLLALATSVVYVALTLWFAKYLFTREKVLFRS
ncbi:MAG: ABC transporter permease [Clostridiales bacterium]|nr:ABC transporter permease [Clostridiales bacterium]